MRARSACLLSLFLASCGSGGGGGGATTPPPANRSPAFSSAGTATTPENATAAVYTVVATDPDGDAITYSVGGTDGALFRITAAGALTFAAAPDFELPADGGANNIYDVVITATDSRGATATLPVAITVTNAGPDAYVLRRVGVFAQPVYVTGVPGGSRVFIVERGGTIRILDPGTGVSSLFLDVRGTISTAGEAGLLGFAAAPDFATTGRVYVYLVNTAGDIEIRRYSTVAGNRDLGDAATADVILRVAHPGFTNHYGGWLEFGPEGFLYLGTGDGGGAGDPNNNAQNPNVLLGKLLRIDVASDAFPADANRDYAIPPSNPFASGTAGAPEVYALGLRNPFRNSFDRATGNLWIADVGQDAVEEIDLLPPTAPGLNYGWPVFEGTRPFRGTTTATPTPPVSEYLHGSGDRSGASVIGGYVYRGPVESLNGLYVFGDFINNNLWTVPAARLAQGTTLPASAYTVRNSDFRPVSGTINSPVGFGTDGANNLYILDFDGEVYRIETAT